MSTLLRTYKYLSFVNCKSKIFSRQLYSVHSSLGLPILHSRTCGDVLHITNPKFRSFSNETEELQLNLNFPSHRHPSHIISANVLLQKGFTKLESDARRKGRLYQRDVESTLKLIKNAEFVSSTQGLLLIKACGSLLAETPKKERSQLAEDVWTTLLELRCSLKLSHYNALLKVHLDNEHDLDPKEFLNMMHRMKIRPNRETYQCLMSRYCQNGDINGASNILEIMNHKKIPMSVPMYNDLIMCNLRENKIEDGRKILEVMRSTNLPISSNTYASLACGYATLGDIANVLATVEEAFTEDASLLDKEIVHIIYTLAISHHEHLVEQVLPLIQYKHGYTRECISTILELINKGFHKVGFTLLNTMPRARSDDGTVAHSGTFFIRQLVKQNVAHDLIIEYCDRMKTLGLNENALLKATEVALVFQKQDAAIAFIKGLHSQNGVIRPHYFWPLLTCRRQNEKDLYDTLKLMVDLKCTADFETFENYFFPYVSINDPSSIVSQLKVIGYEEKIIAQFLTFFLIHNGETQIPAELLEKHTIDNSHVLAVSQEFTKAQDQVSALQVLQTLERYYNTKSTENKSNNIYESFLYYCAVSKGLNASLIEKFLVLMHEKDLRIDVSDAFLKMISNRLDRYRRVQISNLLKKLTSELPEPTLEKPLPLTAVGEFTLNENPSRMLLIHARQKNLLHVQEIMKELDEQNFIYEGCHYGALVELYSFHNNLEKAIYYKGLLDKEFPDFRIREHTVLNLATTLVKNKRINDAENLLLAHNIKHGCQEEPSNIFWNVLQLLDSLSESDEPERTRTFFETLLDYGYCKPKRALLKTLIRGHMLKNNISQAVDEFVRCVLTYKCTSSVSDIFFHLILLKDTQNLQNVMDAAISLYGKGSVYVDLAKSYIDCGEIKEAKIILETPGLQVNTAQFDMICDMYVSMKKNVELEALLQLTKSISGLNRDKMYSCLLRAYVQDENVEKALGVWKLMQEEVFQPSNQILNLLGTFLQKMNQPVPFDIPVWPPGMPVKHTHRNELVQEILEKTNTENFLSVIQKAKLNAWLLDSVDISKIMVMLLEKDHIKEAYKLSANLFESGLHPNIEAACLLVKKLAKEGDRNSLLYLQEKLPEKISSKISLNSYIANTYKNVFSRVSSRSYDEKKTN